jgi:hypothetical protein|tara:strand:- start:637 stop:1320 length:684 start_codon:yes stop_codon:yes gene_type:complete
MGKKGDCMAMKNQLVEININDLIKAEWNYKSDGTEEQIEKLCNSIKKDSSVGVLAVRELDKKFEVIDGNHRLEAVQRLKWTKVPCENFGQITKAKAITVARRRNNQWFSDDAVKYAEIFKNVVLSEYSIDELTKFMPESKQELENISKLIDFDWSEYDKEGVYETNELKSVQFTINEDSYKMWQQWKERCKNILGYDSENLCFEYAIIEALNIPEDTIRLKSKDEEK